MVRDSEEWNRLVQYPKKYTAECWLKDRRLGTKGRTWKVRTYSARASELHIPEEAIEHLEPKFL